MIQNVTWQRSCFGFPLNISQKEYTLVFPFFIVAAGFLCGNVAFLGRDANEAGWTKRLFSGFFFGDLLAASLEAVLHSFICVSLWSQLSGTSAGS